MSKLSECFIQYVVASRNPSTVFLVNGVKLSGIITYTDAECLTLSRDGVTQLIFKHAVGTIMPQDAFSVYDLMDEKHLDT